MDSLFGISRSLYGQPWSCWSTVKELENEEETSPTEENQPAADVMRLPKEDMTLYGFCPEQDDFYIVICELCGLGIKPMGMHHHMNLRHSQGDETIKTATPSKTGVVREYETKPKNKKHVSPASVVSDYGLGVGPPPKAPSAEPNSIILCKENYNDSSLVRAAPNSKAIKIEAEKPNKSSSGNKYNILQNAYDTNAVSKGACIRMNSKSSRNGRTVHISATKSSKTIHKAVPIKSGFRLQLIDTSNCIVFKRNSKSVLNATSELKVRHRKKHRRNRYNNKKGIKARSSRKIVPILPKIPVTTTPIIAPCPSLAPSPYVALTPLKAVKWNNVFEGTPSQLKANRNTPSLNANGVPNRNAGVIHVMQSEEPVLEILNIDTAQNNVFQPEMRASTLMCKPFVTSKTQPEFRLSHIQGNCVLLPTVMSNTSARVPDISWSTVHPKPLGVCPLQARKVGGLITTDRRLDHVWQSLKSALLEQDAYQTTVLCSASSSPPDFHLNHKSSIKTILASLAANNYARNSVCKLPNSNLRQLPHGVNNEKAALSSVIDVSSSVMLLGSNNSKSLSNSNSFISHPTKTTSVIKHDPPNSTTQPYPGIFLRNGHFILPRHFKVCLKRRRAIPVVNNIAKRLKEKASDEATASGRNTQNEHCFPRSVSFLQFPVPNGLSEPVNSYVVYPEASLKQFVPESEIELDVVKSINIFPSNGENLCETGGGLSDLTRLENDFMSGFHNMKAASRIMDVTNKSSCHKASSTSIPNVRISSAPGTVQVNTPQIAYLTAGPVTFQQISPQMIGQIQLQSKPNQTASIPLKLISPAQSVSLTTARTTLLQPEKDES